MVASSQCHSWYQSNHRPPELDMLCMRPSGNAHKSPKAEATTLCNSACEKHQKEERAVKMSEGIVAMPFMVSKQPPSVQELNVSMTASPCFDASSR